MNLNPTLAVCCKRELYIECYEEFLSYSSVKGVKSNASPLNKTSEICLVERWTKPRRHTYLVSVGNLISGPNSL